jgi:hypothetical protein
MHPIRQTDHLRRQQVLLALSLQLLLSPL